LIYLIALASGLLSPVLFANTAPHLLGALTIGPDVVQKGQAQTLSLLPPFENYYTNQNASQTVADGGLFIGVEYRPYDLFWAQFGIAGYVDAQISPEGTIWVTGAEEFETLAYSYDVHSTRLMIEGKLLSALGEHQAINPYVSWGLGVGFNRAANYQEQPLIPGAVPTAAFDDYTQTTLAWSLGLGLDYSVTQHIRLGVGYQFSDLGSVSLGASPATVTLETLSFPNLYANQFRIQFSYLM
jgi:opacity protein-like surface antigen